jgi:hypothetical protein
MHERFTPLRRDPGKPLWEFKEGDHRIYCHRIADGLAVKIILLSGCVKDKNRSKREDGEVLTAKNLLNEFLSLAGGGNK